MKKNVNLTSRCRTFPRVYPDSKKPVLCQVDNFPADNPAYLKADGFRCNDISLLDRLSFGYAMDEDLAKIVASRIAKCPSENDAFDGMTQKQMLKALRPSWCQTASEVKTWEESVYQYMSTQDVTDVKIDDAVKEQKSDVLSSDSARSDDSVNA